MFNARFPRIRKVARVPHPERSEGWGCLFRTIWIVCLLSVSSFAQSANPFAAFQDSLNQAADAALAGVQNPEVNRRDVAGYLSTTPGSVPSPFVALVGRNSLSRVEQLRPMLEPILRAEGIPPELAAVVLVESGGRTTALSSKGALGLWQLMPDTARRYGLTVTTSQDERLDPIKGTHAAARYLHDLYAQFGDWKLALAAYNAGEQAVQRAVQRAGNSDFLRILALLPLETRNYVPAVTSALPLFSGPSKGMDPMRLAEQRGTWLFASRGPRVARVLYAGMQFGN